MSFLSQPITLQSLFGTKRTIGPITVQVIMSEDTNDTLTITKQPVQTGSPITDHSYKEPTVLTMKILQQDNGGLIPTPSQILGSFKGVGLSSIYKQFLDLQNSRSPFNVVTPKRMYQNMLMSVLRCNTDKSTENILSLEVSMQEVFFASVTTVVIPKSHQSRPQKTQGTSKLGKQSALLSGAQAVGIPATGVSQ